MFEFHLKKVKMLILIFIAQLSVCHSVNETPLHFMVDITSTKKFLKVLHQKRKKVYRTRIKGLPVGSLE
jgi:hypothetical protein